MLTSFCVDVAEDFRDLGDPLASEVVDFHLTAFGFIFISYSEMICTNVVFETCILILCIRSSNTN